MTDTTKPDLDAEGFIVYTDEEMDALLSEPTLPYDPAAVDKLLDEIARLQGDDEPVYTHRHVVSGNQVRVEPRNEVSSWVTYGDGNTLPIPNRNIERHYEPISADEPDMMAIFWDNYEASEAASEADDAAFERDLFERYPAFADWHHRERERAIRAGLIPDEPVDDEDSEELVLDDLAS